MKYYAVKKGRNPGIYESRDACLKEVKGYSNAIYKSFKNINDAKEFLNDKKNEDLTIDKDTAIAYVDGSFNLEMKIYGSGVVFIDGDREIYLKEKFEDSYYKHRNVAGELKAAMMAIEKAIEESKKKLIIYHDYQGIASWANGQWKANNSLTKSYKDFIRQANKKIDLAFVKVAGHSGDKYNDMADELAKKACHIKI